MNNPAPRPPEELLSELSLWLGRGAEACDNRGWLLAPLMVLIATWLRDIAESLATLADLIRAGKLLPQQPPAPDQGSRRRTGQPNRRPGRSSHTQRPMPAATAPVRLPHAEERPAPSRPTPKCSPAAAGAMPPRRCRLPAQGPPPAKNGPIQARTLARPYYYVNVM